jgi:hypothetical protein
MARVRVSIVFESGARIGPRKAKLLESIRDTGSISAAAREMGMSYKRAWVLLDSINQAFTEPVVTAAPGGARRITDALLRDRRSPAWDRIVLVIGHDTAATDAMLAGTSQMAAGVAAGFVIGIVAALLGVAGGELLIPTLVLLFGVDIKLAGSLSLAVSLPTMLVGFARYSRDRSFVVLAENRRFVLVMAAGSIVGSRLLGLVPNTVLLPLLAVILVLSAVKVWKHK